MLRSVRHIGMQKEKNKYELKQNLPCSGIVQYLQRAVNTAFHTASRNLRKFPKLRASIKYVLQSVLYIVAIASFHFGLFGLQFLSPISFQVRAQLPTGPPRADGPLGGEGLLLRRRGGDRVPHEQGGVRQDEVKHNSESKYLGERRIYFFKKLYFRGLIGDPCRRARNCVGFRTGAVCGEQVYIYF